MPVHQLHSMAWVDFARLSRDRLVAVLPLGALEAHGPHLPLGTDVVIAEAMGRAGAERLSARGFDVVILPAMPVAPAPFAAAFAGTIDTPPATTTAVIAAVARSLAAHGVPLTTIANAHHDPAHVAAIRAAVDEVNQHGLPRLVFPDLTRRRWATRLTEEFQSGACHAGRYESSVMLAEASQWVHYDRMRDLPPNPQSLVEAIRRGDNSFAEAGGSEAYFGWPADATADEGKHIVESLGRILEEAVIEAWTHAEGKSRMTEPRNAGTSEPRNPGTSEPRNLTIVNPPGRGRPRGFSHGIVAPAGWRRLSVAGQTAIDNQGTVTDRAFVSQFETALAKVIEVVRAAGGEPKHIVRMTIYVTDLEAYRLNRQTLGRVWKRHMESYYPAMALLGVSGLVDPGANVEIEADAVLPPAGGAW